MNKGTILGDAIRAARKNREWTQEELASKVDISYRSLQDIENNKRNVSYDVLAKLIQALDISANHLFSQKKIDTNMTVEHSQFIHDFSTATEREQQLVMDMMKSLIRTRD